MSMAALLNGGAATVLQWQDGHRRALARRYGGAGALAVRVAFDAWLGGAPLAALTQALRSR